MFPLWLSKTDEVNLGRSRLIEALSADGVEAGNHEEGKCRHQTGGH
jgi:hypothetical protein